MSWFRGVWNKETGIPAASVQVGFGAPDSPFDFVLSKIPQFWLSRHCIAGVVLVLALVAQACAQNSAPKFRVAGKVVNAVNGRPLTGAEVWFGKAEDFEATQQRLLTGDDGAFAFTVAAPGKYLLNGQANGFRRQGFEQHEIYVSAIVVGAQLNTENVVFRLRPDARLAGMVEDDDHEPIAGATIYLFRTDAKFGFRQTYFAEQTSSDDRGRYGFAHLEPGIYYVVVSASPWFSGLLEQTDGAGNSVHSQKPEFDIAYPTTFYPGVTEVTSASQIALNEGEHFTADFTLSAVPALRLRVNHLNREPEHPKNPTLQQRIFDTTFNLGTMRQVQVDDSGSVEIRGVAPGQYVLETESFDPSSRNKRSLFINLTADLEVDPENTTPAMTIQGVVRMQGNQNLQQPLTVRLWNSRTGLVVESGTREKGQIYVEPSLLTPGTYSVYAMNGLNSIIGSLKATGAQVVGQTIQITGGKPVQLEIEMSTTTSKISGVARRDGQPVAGTMILLVPEEAEINLPKFRRDQSDSDGTFTLLDVLPGRYRMLAIEDGWDLEWANLSLLKQRLEHAQPIDVGPSKSYQAVVEVQ